MCWTLYGTITLRKIDNQPTTELRAFGKPGVLGHTHYQHTQPFTMMLLYNQPGRCKLTLSFGFFKLEK